MDDTKMVTLVKEVGAEDCYETREEVYASQLREVHHVIDSRGLMC
jgi:hypothetical protein